MTLYSESIDSSLDPKVPSIFSEPHAVGVSANPELGTGDWAHTPSDDDYGVVDVLPFDVVIDQRAVIDSLDFWYDTLMLLRVILKDSSFVYTESDRALDICDDWASRSYLLHHRLLTARAIITITDVERRFHFDYLWTLTILGARPSYCLRLIGGTALTWDSKALAKEAIEHRPSTSASFNHEIALNQELG